MTLAFAWASACLIKLASNFNTFAWQIARFVVEIASWLLRLPIHHAMWRRLFWPQHSIATADPGFATLRASRSLDRKLRIRVSASSSNSSIKVRAASPALLSAPTW